MEAEKQIALEQKQKLLFNNCSRLVKQPEWTAFELHIEERIQSHKDLSVSFLAKDNLVDAQRQAWIVEGLLEALHEPDNVIKAEESFLKTIRNIVLRRSQERKLD